MLQEHGSSMTQEVIHHRHTSDRNMALRAATRVLQDVVDKIGPWHSELALMSLRAARRCTDAERAAILTSCARIALEALEARAGIIAGLVDAPPAIRGHSRVVDVERSLDVVDARIADLRSGLTGQSRS